MIKTNESEKDMEKSKCNFSNERSQSDKATYSRIPTMWHSEKGITIVTVKRLMIDILGIKGRINVQSTADFYLLQWNYSVWYCNGEYTYITVHLSKSIECATQRMSTDRNYEP